VILRILQNFPNIEKLVALGKQIFQKHLSLCVSGTGIFSLIVYGKQIRDKLEENLTKFDYK
jgi:hypothetical protein